MKCKKCEREIGEGVFCPECGTPVKKNMTMLLPWTLTIILAVVMLFGCILLFSQKKVEDQEMDIPQNVYEEDSDDETIKNQDDFIFPESNQRYITKDDLFGREREEIALIRNEIFARRGYIFTKSPYKEYFTLTDWYVPNPEFSQGDFNEYEKANIKMIVKYEEDRGWREDADTITVKADGYLYPTSDIEYMTREELAFYTKTELAYIRNEIYARHGYIFKKSPYKEYFAEKSWYKPNKNFSENLLNKYEKANIALIKDFEEGSVAILDYSDNWKYILPYSDYEYISIADLLGRSKDEVAFIRNEIYARRGYVFKKEPYKSYFNSKSWYLSNKNFSTNSFNKYETANLKVIDQYEKSMGWK